MLAYPVQSDQIDGGEHRLLEVRHQDHIVFTPVGRLDASATDALIRRAAAALRCAMTVMIDLDPLTASDELLAHGPVPRSGAEIIGDHGPVEVLGAGVVQVRTADMRWTIDLNGSQMVRSEKRIDPYFLSGDRWTPIRALWADCETVTALTADGVYLTCGAVWTAGADVH